LGGHDCIVVDVLRITTTSGGVLIVAEQRAEIDIAGGRLVEGHRERTVRGGSEALTVRVPLRSDVVIGTASGAVELQGELGNVSVTTASGHIRADDVASIDARTASGSLEVQTSRGNARLKTGGSRVRLHTVDGELRVATISGKVQIEHASALVSIRTVSGDVDLELAATGGATVETISGDVRIVVPAGLHPSARLRTISGTRHVACEAGEDLEIAARSVSGDLSVLAVT
jgi:DUF4097 and DUF4098 domain-containing protein YvlB